MTNKSNGYKSVFWSVAVQNIVLDICFSVVAIYFGQSWIALFALLGQHSAQFNRKQEHSDENE